MSRPTAKMCYSDLLALPEDGKRHELIDGKHLVSPSQSTRHQLVLANLFRSLDGFVRPRGLGEVLFAPFDVFLSEHDVVVPDLVFLHCDRRAIAEAQFWRGAPELAIEVLSPSTRQVDLQIKRRAYRRFRFGEYWIVDPIGESIAVFRGDGDWAEPTLRLQRGSGAESAPGRDPAPPNTLTNPLFPGLVLGLDQVFA